MIVATHGHFDHIMAAFALQLAYNIPFAIHSEDVFLVNNMQSSAKHFLNITADPPPKITTYLHDGETIGNFTVMQTPGHTPGSICFYSRNNNVIFSGDTIFADGTVGRTDHHYSNPLALSQSVKKIVSLPPETTILSGHGDETTAGKESGFHKN
jgi:glyoxylase-like metal-dependent hydrolase (beta-lactamase superfamily II)